MFGALRRQETRVLVSHLVCDEIAVITVDLSSTVINTAGLMAHYAAVYMFALLVRTMRLYDTRGSSERISS